MNSVLFFHNYNKNKDNYDGEDNSNNDDGNDDDGDDDEEDNDKDIYYAIVFRSVLTLRAFSDENIQVLKLI